MRPHFSITFATPSRAAVPSLTLAAMVIASPPPASMSAATWPMPTSSRSTSASLAPSAANRRAEAAPMPEAAPVTMATLSLSFMTRSLARLAALATAADAHASTAATSALSAAPRHHVQPLDQRGEGHRRIDVALGDVHAIVAFQIRNSPPAIRMRSRHEKA